MSNKMLPCFDVSMTVTDGAAGALSGREDVVVQIKGPNGEDATEAALIQYYLAKDAAGQTLCVDGTDTTDITVETDGVQVAETRADIAGWAVSEADGDIDFRVYVASAKVAYLIIVTPDGRLHASGALTYAT